MQIVYNAFRARRGPGSRNKGTLAVPALLAGESEASIEYEETGKYEKVDAHNS
jgi:hypothetical protein